MPLKPGVTVQQAQLQGTTGVNAGKPVLNANDFAPQFLAPGQSGVPPCAGSACDDYESLFGTSGRNLFRGPFQVRFDMSLAKEFALSERFRLRFNFNAFNIFNHPNINSINNTYYFSQATNVSNFGYAATAGDMRQMEFSVRVNF